jgi:Kef-type K+ transport system membrane component KefB
VEQLWSGVIIWLGLAFLASLISWRLGISVALVELVVGITAGNSFHLEITPWVNFLASLGALVLTFLAGAELESAVIKKFWKASLALGVVSFAAPFALAWMLAQFVFGWGLRAAQIAGLAMSTTSVAVVYAVMVETGLNETPLGKLILAACFVTDLGTVIALGLLFTNFGATFWIFVAATAVAMATLPRITPFLLRKLNAHSSEPEVRYLLLVLAGLALLAVRGGSEGVLPAYLVGMVLADAFLGNRELIKRMRATTFALLTPFYFLKAGSLVSLRAVLASLGRLLRGEDRGEVPRPCAGRPRPGLHAARQPLLDDDDEHRPHVRDDRGAVWPQQRGHHQGAILCTGSCRDPHRDCAYAGGAVVLRTACAGDGEPVWSQEGSSPCLARSCWRTTDRRGQNWRSSTPAGSRAAHRCWS